MRIFAQDRAFYRGVRVDLGDRPEADRRFKLLRRVERVRGHGLTLGRRWPCWACPGAPATTGGRFEKGGMRGLAPRSSRPRTHPGRQWTPADALRARLARSRGAGEYGITKHEGVLPKTGAEKRLLAGYGVGVQPPRCLRHPFGEVGQNAVGAGSLQA